MKIKAVVFDLGGVVLTHTKEITLEIFSKIFQGDLKDIADFYKTIEDDWAKGKINDREVILKYKTKFHSKLSVDELLSQHQRIYEDGTKINREVLGLVGELKNDGYKVYILSDTVDIHHRLNLQRDLFSHFDKVFASFIERKRKTNKDFFEHFLKETSLKAKECIFIDDREKNVKLARQVGIYSILFKDYQDLNKKLKSLLI